MFFSKNDQPCPSHHQPVLILVPVFHSEPCCMRALACLRGEAVEVLHYFGDALWEAPECSGGLEGHVLSHVPSHDLTILLCFVK